VERLIERALFAARWLLVPLYVGLALLLVLFCFHFYRELWHMVAGFSELGEVDIILGSLSLVDLTLIGGLIVMVMLSGYENFVSKLDIVATETTIGWLGKLDTGSLKLKVAATIVAISAIQLLKAFMEIGTLANDKVVLLIATHLTFVVSALLLAVTDRLTAARHDH
jgi:uncharacterized protein (TIGR00645 family)